MSDFLIVAGILTLVTVSEFVLWKIYEFFDDESDGAEFLFATNVVIVTFLISLRVLGH